MIEPNLKMVARDQETQALASSGLIKMRKARDAKYATKSPTRGLDCRIGSLVALEVGCNWRFSDRITDTVTEGPPLTIEPRRKSTLQFCEAEPRPAGVSQPAMAVASPC